MSAIGVHLYTHVFDILYIHTYACLLTSYVHVIMVGVALESAVYNVTCALSSAYKRVECLGGSSNACHGLLFYIATYDVNM